MAKKILLLMSLAIICFFGGQSMAFAQGMHEIHAEIQKKGARWQVGDTSMSRLSFAEQQKRLGLVRPVLTGREPRLSLEAAPPVELAAGMDWRNHGGNFVTPIRDQGGCGSCWAFATAAALESTTLISNQTPGIDLNLAEQVLVSCGNSGSCDGGYISTASDFFKNTGLPVETCYPYTATNGSCSSACASWQSSAYRISSWQYVATSSPTVEGIKNALYNYGPLVTTMAVYQDFFSYHTGVYSYVSGSLAGYHAVLIVGYDDAGQYFIVKNSWGTWWGEAGYFRIAYSELNSVVGFGDWTIAYIGTAPACSYNVSQPSPSTIAGSGGSGSINVNTSSGCPWTASSNATWISITSGASGTGPGTVYISVSANTGSSSRTGSLRVAGQMVTVPQDAGVSCTYSLNPTQQNIGASAGTGSVGVTAGSGCPWTAGSNTSWINITAGSSGNGGGTVVYSVAGNSSTSSRTGTLTIGGQTFTVSQSGISCAYTISPASSSVSVSGGSGSVNVTAPGGCTWTAVSNAAWITVNPGSGSGNGSVSYSAAANTTINPRTGTLTIGGQTFTVSQGGISCAYTISPASSSVSVSGGSGSVNVTAPGGCTWTAVSNATWITVSPGSGSGNGSVSYSAAVNTTINPRTGTLTIGGQTFTVSQGGISCSYAISPTSSTVSVTGGTGPVSVTAPGGCSWTAVSNAAWITVNPGSGSGNGSVSYSAAANTTINPRTGTLTIGGQTFTVSQGGISCAYTISPASSTVSVSGGSGSVNVTATSGCTWTAVSNASWITVTPGSGSGNGSVSYSAAANTTINPRTGTLTIGGQTFTVSQGGISCAYTISPASSSVSVSGGSGSVNVTATSGCTWTAVSNASWITVTPGSGSGNGQVNYSAAANTTINSRTGTLTIGGQTFTVSQAGIGCSYAISPASQSFGASGGVGGVSVTTPGGCNWSAASNDSWIAVASSSTRAGSNSVSYSVQPNNSSSARTGSMTIAGKTFTVSQAAAGGIPDISVAPAVIDFGNLRVGSMASKIVKVTNAGNGPLTITSVAVFGGSKDSFKESHECISIAPGASCEITVTFAPNRSGGKRAGLRIYSNDPDENPVAVLLRGGALGTHGGR